MSNPKKYALMIGLVGILISSLVVFVERRMISINNQNQPYIALGEYLKNISTKAHLWFEEAMSGDQSIDIDRDVYGFLDNSIRTLEAAIQGEDTDVGKFYRTDDRETLGLLNECISDVRSLRRAAEKRWQFRQQTLKQSNVATAGEEAGGLLDQEFDASYEELQETYDKLVAHVKRNVVADNAVLNKLSWTSIVLIIGVFAILSWLLYVIQFKNDTLTTTSNAKLAEEIERVKKFNTFVQSISAGDYTAELSITDELGTQLIRMRDALRDNSESEKKRNWASTGLAEIGDVLRSNFKTLGDLYDKIIQYVVKYTGSNQGFFFIVNDEDENHKYLELVSAYAFDRKKYLKKTIEFGESLVGQCYLEGRTIHTLDVPQDYITITSGLGGSNPRSLLLVPLKINGDTLGIFELASFRDYHRHDIALIERFAESVASSLSAIRISERTRILLERTQQQAEEMRAQEEEMRQNMEELSATQEEMSRKEQEYIARIRELEATDDAEFRAYYRKKQEAAITDK